MTFVLAIVSLVCFFNISLGIEVPCLTEDDCALEFTGKTDDPFSNAQIRSLINQQYVHRFYQIYGGEANKANQRKLLSSEELAEDMTSTYAANRVDIFIGDFVYIDGIGGGTIGQTFSMAKFGWTMLHTNAEDSNVFLRDDQGYTVGSFELSENPEYTVLLFDRFESRRRLLDKSFVPDVSKMKPIGYLVNSVSAGGADCALLQFFPFVTVHERWLLLDEEPGLEPDVAARPSNFYTRVDDYGYSVHINDVVQVLSEEGRFGTGSGAGACVSMYDSFKIELAYKGQNNDIIVDVDDELTDIPPDMRGFSGMYCFLNGQQYLWLASAMHAGTVKFRLLPWKDCWDHFLTLTTARVRVRDEL